MPGHSEYMPNAGRRVLGSRIGFGFRKGSTMLTTVLIVLVILFLLGGGIGFRSNKTYGYGGIGIGTVLLIVLIILLLRGGV